MLLSDCLPFLKIQRPKWTLKKTFVSSVEQLGSTTLDRPFSGLEGVPFNTEWDSVSQEQKVVDIHIRLWHPVRRTRGGLHYISTGCYLRFQVEYLSRFSLMQPT